METLRYVVLTNVLLAIMSLAYYILLRRETFFEANRLALWMGLASTIILPLLELPDWRPQPVRTVMQRTAQVIVPKVLPEPQYAQPDVTITFPNQKSYQAFQTQSEKFIWSWQTGLIALYVSVVFLLLLRFGIQLVSLRKLIRRSVQETYDDFTLIHTEGVTSPFSFFGWVFINRNQHTPDELDQILRHERVHVRERHSFDMIGAEIVCILFWFNPAAYLFRHLIHQTLEFSADRTVLSEGVDIKAYQYNLLKVSLLADRSAITNHFSKSQLKPRIVMLNRQKSPKAAWLKYPIFSLTALIVASAFAHTQPIKALSHYVSKPVAETIRAIAEPARESSQLVGSAEQTIESEVDKSTLKKPLVQQSMLQLDSVSQQFHPDTARVSPSQYMQYEGDKLYWIITAKTSFDDLAIMKQEFKRHGYKMQVQTLKYDPLNSYISDIKVTIIRPTAGISDFEETGVDGAPIQSYGGYNGLNALKNVAAVGSYPFNADFMHIPEGLVQIARNEELFLAKFIHDNKMKYLIATGKKISNKYAPSSTIFNMKGLLDQSDIIRKYGIKLNADSTLDISDTHLPVFINNESVSNEAVKRIAIKKFDTLISSEDYGRNGQQGAIRALLFYTNDLK